jgi:hypothetical protein
MFVEGVSFRILVGTLKLGVLRTPGHLLGAETLSLAASVKTAHGARIGFLLSCVSPSLPSSAFFSLWSLQVRAHLGSAYFYC